MCISSQFENNHFTEMCSGSEAGSYLRLIDVVYHSTLGLRVITKKKKDLVHHAEEARRDGQDLVGLLLFRHLRTNNGDRIRVGYMRTEDALGIPIQSHISQKYIY